MAPSSAPNSEVSRLILDGILWLRGLVNQTPLKAVLYLANFFFLNREQTGGAGIDYYEAYVTHVWGQQLSNIAVCPRTFIADRDADDRELAGSRQYPRPKITFFITMLRIFER